MVSFVRRTGVVMLLAVTLGLAFDPAPLSGRIVSA